MATRLAFENSNEIGVFCALTNAYCLTGMLCQYHSHERYNVRSTLNYIASIFATNFPFFLN